MLKIRQKSNAVTRISSCIVAVILALLCLSACTANLNVIPAPPPSAKLRVFVLAVTESDPPGKIWATSNQTFTANMTLLTGKYLNRTGIYHVVPENDIRAVLGHQEFTGWQWLREDMALLRKVGKALHADYAIITTRGYRANFEFMMRLVNLETGRTYEAEGRVHHLVSGDWIMNQYKKMVLSSYLKVFYKAKGDLLATAIRKGRFMPGKEAKKPATPDAKIALAPHHEFKPAPTPPAEEMKPTPVMETPAKPAAPPPIPESLPAAKPPVLEEKAATSQEPLKPETTTIVSEPQTEVSSPLPERTVKPAAPDIREETVIPAVIAKATPPPHPDLKAEDKRLDFEKKLEKELGDEKVMRDISRLVVYDFVATDRLNVVALILTEALREELFILGRFKLVNRENMMQVMEELKLQQSGMIDEKQSVELGKWLAANETITGRLAVLGNTYVLQAKRTDIKTLGTLGLGSLKCATGHEEELLTSMPGLAKKLIEARSQ